MPPRTTTAKGAESYAVLDRLQGMGGYTAENTRLICKECDTRIQRERRYP